MTWVESRVAEAAQQIVGAKEQYILDFFGSREAAERYGGDYVFEEYEIEHNISSGFDEESRVLTFRQKFRLRRKTDEERAAETERMSNRLEEES